MKYIHNRRLYFTLRGILLVVSLEQRSLMGNYGWCQANISVSNTPNGWTICYVCMYMHVCMYVCMYVSMYAYMHVLCLRKKDHLFLLKFTKFFLHNTSSTYNQWIGRWQFSHSFRNNYVFNVKQKKNIYNLVLEIHLRSVLNNKLPAFI